MISDTNVMVANTGDSVTAKDLTTGAVLWTRPGAAEVIALHDGEGAVLREGNSAVIVDRTGQQRQTGTPFDGLPGDADDIQVRKMFGFAPQQ